MLKALKENYILFLEEALGLFIFMVSACFFSGYLNLDKTLPYFKSDDIRQLMMAFAMGTTALLIFLSPMTEPSGAFINPAVTIMRWRLGQLSLENTIWYCLFQTAGGLAAVYLMSFLMGPILTDPPVNYAVTVPGFDVNIYELIFTETFTAFLMIAMILFFSDIKSLKNKVPYFAALLVGIYVYFAGPVSGFGMNPARTIASAVPSGIYTEFGVYMLCPVLGMLLSAEMYLHTKNKKPVVHWKLDGK